VQAVWVWGAGVAVVFAVRMISLAGCLARYELAFFHRI